MGKAFNLSHRRGKLLLNGFIINPSIDQGFVDILMTQEFLQGGDAYQPKLPPVVLWAILIIEVDPPARVEALEWFLLTTGEIANVRRQRFQVNPGEDGYLYLF
jgi:hypothetical protein